MEPWVIDEYDRLWGEAQNLVADGKKLADDLGACQKDVDKPHDAQIFHEEKLLDRECSHFRPCDSADSEAGVELEEGFNEFGSMEISAHFTGCDKQIDHLSSSAPPSAPWVWL